MRASEDARIFFVGKQFRLGLLLWFALLVTYYLYAPGIAPGFLFDDYINLNVLGSFGTIDNWDSFLQYLLSGKSSSLGRIVSVASFLIDDNAWPSNAESFKYTNVLFHMLSGALLAWLFYQVMLATGRDSKQAGMIAVMATALWLLHPLHVSTVLYPVQRMTIMAAIFVILGLALYVKGRLLLAEKKYPVKAFSLMASAIVVCMPLAVMSKENGALLPLLIIVLNYTVMTKVQIPTEYKRIYYIYIMIFILLPLIVIAGYFIANWDQKIVQQYMLRRPFTLTERLLTEPRVLLDYLRKIFLPRIQTAGLYYDNYEYSKGLLEPPITIISITVISGMAAAGFYLRRKLPFLSAAILFFFAGHVLESSFIPLELYFEHRNYLPSIFIFLAITISIVHLIRIVDKSYLITGLSIMLVTVLGGMTYARASLWSDIDKLALVWAMENPNAVRTQQHAAIIWQQMGQLDKSIKYMQRAVENSPDKLVLHLQELSLHCRSDNVDKEKRNKIKEIAKKDVFDQYTGETFGRLIDRKNEGGCPALNYDFLESVLLAALENPWNQALTARKQEIYYHLGRMYLDMGKYDKAKEAMFKAYNARPKSIEAGLQIVAVLATYKQYKAGLELIDKVEATHNKNRSGIPVSRSEMLENIRDLDKEIERIRDQLVSDIAKEY